MRVNCFQCDTLCSALQVDITFCAVISILFTMKTFFTAGLLLLLASYSVSDALPTNSFHRLLDLAVPDEYLESPSRSVREANPESFSDYFKKLQLAQSELQKNASVGEEEVEKVFKNHGLDIGNETNDQTGTTTDSSESVTKEISSTTDLPYSTSTQKQKKGICKSKSCAELSEISTMKPLKKQINKPEITTVIIPTESLTSTTFVPDETNENSTETTTESDTTMFPLTTTSYSLSGWWGVSRKSEPKHLKSTIARQVVNKIKTSRRRSHFD